MDFVAELNCPQYVNFKLEFNNKYDSLTDAEISSRSVEESIESENMLVDDDSKCYYGEEDEISYSENIQSTQSLCYTPDDNGCQQSQVDPDCQSEVFSVNRPRHASLPEKRSKKIKTCKSDLNVSRKRKREYECNEYVPLAEQVAAFQRKTPKRFHTTGPKAFEPSEHWTPPSICPKSPNLKAAKRRRGVNVLSREEQEAKEVEEMKRYRFHAQPVKYDAPGYSQLPNVGKKALTKPQHLNLRTAQRAAESNAKKKEEKPYEFRARPVPKAIITGPTGLKEKPPLHVTQPQTPNFALKSRAQKWKSEKKLKELCSEAPKFKAMPAPSATSQFVIKHEKKLTEIQPFSFEEKDKERQARKKKKINEEIEKENRVFVFKAQPMPSSVPSPLPAIPKKPVTHPQPFNLYTDNRSFKQNSLNLSEDTCKSFKAKPATVLQKAPFVPEKPPKAVVETKEFHLHTEVRAAIHQKLKEEMDIKEQEKAQLLEELRLRQEEEERQEIAKLRKEAVHKANPIRNYKQFELKPSDKPLTMPMSPNFLTDERIQLRHEK